MTAKSTRIARLKQFQAERGLSGPAELGRAIGRKTNQTSDLLHGRAPFGERVARAIEAFAGLPAGWLDEPSKQYELRFSRSPGTAIGEQSDSARVRPLPGAEVGPAAVRPPLLLSREWVRAVAVAAAGELHYLPMPDDVMSPLLSRGDLLLVDAAVREFGRDGVYVLRAGERLLVRQLRARLDGRIEVSAGSAAGGASEVAEAAALSVVAQAIWVWRGQPL